MGYTDVFGGQLLFPSQLSYLAITTAVDVTLQWPREQQIEGTNVVADFLDISATAVGLNIDMPDARNTSTGNKSTINNVGANNFTVRDATGGTIQVVGTGEQWVLVLTDNSTEAGTWSAFQLGAATTLASASALAGAGLQADGFGLLEQIIDSDVEAATPITVVDGDRAKCLIYTAGAGTCNLPSPGTVGNNWFFMLRNSGSGTLNIVPPSGTIDGSASLNLDPNGSTFIFTDGTNFYTIGLTVASTIAFDFVSIAVPGSGDFVLSGANLDRISYRFTGALTGNRRIVVPNTTQQYWVDNQTSGAFTLEIDTAAGAGQIVPQGESAIVYCDATDVINAVSSTSVTFPITIGQGGTGATTVGGAQINLQVPPDSRLVSTSAAGGLSGGGDLSSDRTHVIALAGVPTATPDLAADFFLFQDVDDTDLTKKALLSTLGITVEEEGVPLAGIADTLNFTGGIVTASGGGSTKTIDIPIVASSGASVLLRGDGAGGWSEPPNILIDSIGRLECNQVTFFDANAHFRANATDYTAIGSFGTETTVSATGAITGIRFSSYDLVEIDGGNLKMFEVAAPQADEAAYGQIWIRNDDPNNLMFTDDTGNDIAITEQGYLGGDNTKWKTSDTTRNTTGVSADPDLQGWLLEPGYYEIAGVITIGVNPGTNGGIDLNWDIVSGTIPSANDSCSFLAQNDVGTSPSGIFWGVFDLNNVTDLTLTYATRNDETRCFITGKIEVTVAADVDFQWAPRLAGNLTMSEGSWIRFKRLDQ